MTGKNRGGPDRKEAERNDRKVVNRVAQKRGGRERRERVEMDRKAPESGDKVSPFRQHAERWEHCTACLLCGGRSKVVLARGRIPCDILFVGESPGESEDSLGLPFIGPAGKLLDRIVSEAIEGREVRIAFTNLVCCIPRDEDGGKTAEPPPEAIEACALRLEEFVALAKPRLIVCVGRLSRNWIMGMPNKGKRYLLLDYQGPLVEIVHPAAILRANISQRDLAVQKTVITLREAAEEI